MPVDVLRPRVHRAFVQVFCSEVVNSFAALCKYFSAVFIKSVPSSFLEVDELRHYRVVTSRKRKLQLQNEKTASTRGYAYIDIDISTHGFTAIVRFARTLPGLCLRSSNRSVTVRVVVALI
jgi:hypothetical protein